MSCSPPPTSTAVKQRWNLDGAALDCWQQHVRKHWDLIPQSCYINQTASINGPVRSSLTQQSNGVHVCINKLFKRIMRQSTPLEGCDKYLNDSESPVSGSQSQITLFRGPNGSDRSSETAAGVFSLIFSDSFRGVRDRLSRGARSISALHKTGLSKTCVLVVAASPNPNTSIPFYLTLRPRALWELFSICSRVGQRARRDVRVCACACRCV